MGFLNKLLGVSEYASPVADMDIVNLDIGEATSADADKLCNLGNSFFRNKQFANAIEIYKKVIQINSQHSRALNGLGAAYTEFGLPDKAIEHLKQATHVAPEYANAWYNLGNAYFKSTEYNKAAEAFREAIRINPEHVQAKQFLELLTIPG